MSFDELGIAVRCELILKFDEKQHKEAEKSHSQVETLFSGVKFVGWGEVLTLWFRMVEGSSSHLIAGSAIKHKKYQPTTGKQADSAFHLPLFTLKASRS